MTSRGNKRVLAGVCLALVIVVVAPVGAAAISRSWVLERAQVWVLAKVPYSQKRSATVEGSLIPTSTPGHLYAGYRTDCSGYVSMAFNLRTKSGNPYSLSTATLRPRLTRISKADLLPGDVILRPNDLVIDGKRVAYGHAVIFGEWTDSTRAHYVGYHESASQKGAVRSVIRYGTSGFGSAVGFAPYRYTAVRDRVKLETRRTQ